jgi:hypothetical protein
MLMVVRLPVILGALIFLIGAGCGASAQPSFSPEPTDVLSAGEGATYLDLLQLIVPGIAVSGSTYSGGQPIGMRHIQGWADGDVGLAPTGVLGLAAAPVRSGGSDRMALLVDFGGAGYSVGFAILALFDVQGEPRLLDAADIASGQWTSFMDPVRLSVSADDDLLVTQSTHHNSSQGYANASLILVRNDRFELVDTIGSFSDKDCGFERSQTLTIEQGGGKPLADVVATVVELTVLTAEGCGGRTGPEPGRRTITVTYRWDAAAQRYAPDSDAFTQLADENEQRF